MKTINNSEKFIKSTIKSVQHQTYQNWEMIIIDDGSTDGSADVVKTIIKEDLSNDLIDINSLSIKAFRKEASFLINYYRFSYW